MYTIAFNAQETKAVEHIMSRLAQSQYFISPVQGLVFSEDPGVIFAIASTLNNHNIPYAASPLPLGPWRKRLVWRLTDGYNTTYSCWMCGKVSVTEAFCKHCTSISLVENPIGSEIQVSASAGLLEIWWMTRFRSGNFFPGANVELTLKTPAETTVSLPPGIITVAKAITGTWLAYNIALRILDGYYAFGTDWKTPRADHNLMLLHERFPSYNVPPEISILRAAANYPALLSEVGEYGWSIIMDNHKELLEKESLSSH